MIETCHTRSYNLQNYAQKEENSIAFSGKSSRRRRIINLDLYFEGNYCFNNSFLMRQSVIGSIWRYAAISF